MEIPKKKILFSFFILLIILLSAEDKELRPYRLVNADDLQMTKYFEEYVTRLTGNVIFFYGKTQFKCDQAEIYEDQKVAILRGNVRIKEDSLTFYSDQAEYFKSNEYIKATGRVIVREDHVDKTYREIRANQAEFYRDKGDMQANQNVRIYDQRDNIRGKCGYATYNLKTGYGYLIREPLIWKISESDSFSVASEKIEYFNDLQKIIASFNVITKSKDVSTKSDFLIYYGKEEKAVYFGQPRFYSDFGDAEAENITLYMPKQKLTHAVLQDSCKIKFAQEKNEPKVNTVTGKVMDVYWKNDLITQFVASENVSAFIKQEKKKNKEPMSNYSYGKKLIVNFDKQQKIDNVNLVAESKGKYLFKKKK